MNAHCRRTLYDLGDMRKDIEMTSTKSSSKEDRAWMMELGESRC